MLKQMSLSRMKPANPKEYRLMKIVLPISIYLILLAAAYIYNLIQWDWYMYRYASLMLLNGQNPYGQGLLDVLATHHRVFTTGFYNPPWVLLPLIPFAVLPERIGQAFVFANNITILCVLGYYVSRSIWKSLAFLFSLPALYCLRNGQIDALLLLGMLLPKPVGLFLLLAKPQIGGGIALYWVWKEWREKGILAVIKLLLPVTLAYLASFAIFGFYPGQSGDVVHAWWNTSIWPYGLIAVPVLIYGGIKHKKPGLALSSAPFASPYLGFYTWSATVLGLMDLGNWFYLVIPLSYIPVFLHVGG